MKRTRTRIVTAGLMVCGIVGMLIAGGASAWRRH